MELYEKIQALRIAKGLTQAGLAEKIDVSRQSVQKWEAGTTSPDIAKLPELAALLGVSVDALLSRSLARDDLLAQAVRPVEPRPRRSVVDWLLLIPLGLGFALVVGMFYLFGAMLAGMGLVLSLFCLLAAVAAIPLTLMNLSQGPGAVLVGLAVLLLGGGLCAPVFFLSRWWWSVYRSLARRLTARLQKIPFKNLL